MKWLAAVAGLLFLGVAFHEWSYAHDHSYAYGPAKVIALAGLAGALLSFGVVFGLALLDVVEERLGVLTARVATIEAYFKHLD